MAATDERREDVQARLDILWSRVNIYNTGEVGRRLNAIDGGTGTIAALVESLNAVDPDLQALGAGGRDGIATVRAQLEPHALPLYRLAQRMNLHEQSMAIDFRVKTGRTYWLLMTFFIGALAGGAVLIVLLIREIRNTAGLLETANKAERRARQNADHLAAVQNNTAVSIITFDSTRRITSFNPAAAELFGYAAGEVIGRNVSVLMPDPDRTSHDAYVAKYLETGKTTVIGRAREVTGLHKDGHTIPLELSAGSMWSDGKQYFVGFLTDTTARKEAADGDDCMEVPRGNETVLIADDEEAVLHLARIILEGLGYDVLTAASGLDAIDVFHGHGGDIDLLVTDLRMPGLNGRELASMLIAEYPDLRIVFITGYDVIGVHDREPGVALLKKPLDPDEMGYAVRRVLDGPSTAAAA